MIVGLHAHTIDVIDHSGDIIATHPRRFGSSMTRDVDILSTLEPLSRKPGAWSNSLLRKDLPAEIAEWMDDMDHEERAHLISMLKSTAESVGYRSVVAALGYLSRQPRPISAIELEITARRIDTFGLDAKPDPGPDLTYYDDALLRRRA